MMLIGNGYEDRILTVAEVGDICSEALSKLDLARKRLLVLIPDSTRTAPVPLFFRLLCEQLLGLVSKLDFIIALGTHPPMTEEAIDKLLGVSTAERTARFPGVETFNHAWDNADALARIGTISADEIALLANDLLREEVAVTINRRAFDYDRLLIVGPTFPHEVVGFSGGNKYLFPGIAGQGIIDLLHWLGAVITNPVIIGNKHTPVRELIDRAAALMTIPRLALSLVVKDEGLAGIYLGSPEESWSRAADLSARLHIIYKDRPFHTVLSQAPEMYEDIWTAGKCMYKLEPVVADGGTLIIYAPHIKEVSVTHGEVIEQVGYHTRDYFLRNWDRFQQYPWGVLAHCTHVRGIGCMEDEAERPRVNVVLATQIPPETCAKISLGYMDPATIDPQDYANREQEGVLYVPKAGETLYRLKTAPPELGGGSP